MQYSLILLNGGVGKRAAQGQPKQFFKINGIPIIVYTLVAADSVEAINEIVVNYPDGWLPYVKEIVSDYAIRTPVKYVEAGSSRHESVSLMVSECSNDNVIIHESARPMITSSDFDRLIESEQNNVSFMLPISFTVAPVNPEISQVEGTLDRSKLRNVQLPQKYRKSDLMQSHQYAKDQGVEFTEDATLCAVAGFDVFFIEGVDRNIKVTTLTDIRIAGFLLGGSDKDE